VRLDLGLYRNMEVGLNYDPMLAKLIVWGPNREQAIARMRRALQELNIGGVKTSAPAALAVLEHERFQKGDFDTHFLEGLDLAQQHTEHDALVAVAAAIWRHRKATRRALAPQAGEREGWTTRSRKAREQR
jgi:acetyl/propionyl-CoA carboxylase alpha subunit